MEELAAMTKDQAGKDGDKGSLVLRLRLPPHVPLSKRLYSENWAPGTALFLLQTKPRNFYSHLCFLHQLLLLQVPFHCHSDFHFY